MNFEIDEQYVTSVGITESGSIYKGKSELTDDELVKVLKGEDRWSSYGHDDHPKFKELREELGRCGFIQIQRSWWNGDRVLKPFKLNGVKFKKGEQFSCASAMLYHLQHAKKTQI